MTTLTRQAQEKYILRNYDKISKKIGYLCGKYGKQSYTEDAVQEYCMNLLEGKAKHQLLDYWFSDYSVRQKWIFKKGNIHKRGKLEFVGEDDWKLENAKEESSENSFLLLMDDFCSNLNLNTGAYKWLMEIQKERLLSHKRIKFDSLIKLLEFQNQ